MDNLFYTYAYLREDGTPYYIGKGKGRRAFYKHGQSIKAPPEDRILFLKKNLTEEEAFKHEIYMIAVLGRKDLGTGILRNLTNGGDGTSGWKAPLEWREKVSLRQLGRKVSPETVEKRRQKNIGQKRTDETRKNISEGMKGKNKNPKSEEHRKKIANALKGRKIGTHSKEVTIYFPTGRVGVFPSITSAALYLGMSGTTLSQWLKGKAKPNGFLGYRVRLSALA